MISVSPINEQSLKAFASLFTDYYKELDCEEDFCTLAKECILPELIIGLIKIDILKDGDTFAGFVIYQKDDIDHEWNFKEGWGDIREIYVIPSLRRQGFGRFLMYTAEMKLKELGVTRIYCLPEEKAESFFIACGYEKTEGYNPELDCVVFEKKNLNNCECTK